MLYAPSEAPERIALHERAGRLREQHALEVVAGGDATLESRGLLRRTPDLADGRYTLAILTDLGHDKVEQATRGTCRSSTTSSSTD